MNHTNNDIQLSTEDPLGPREGFGDVVQPSRQCLQAASSESETSRSRGDSGSSPGYPSRDPFCSSSSALAVTVTGEEQSPRPSPVVTVILDDDSPWLPPVPATGQNLGFQSNNISDVSRVNEEGLTSPRNTDNHLIDATRSELPTSNTNTSALPHQAHPDDATSWEEINRNIRKVNRPPSPPRSSKSTRSNLNISSLNMNGRDQNKSIHHTNHKFNHVKRTIDENGIGVLALQETHLDDIGVTQFNNVFQRWFKILNSSHPSKPTSTAGVSFILNKKFVDTENIREYVLIPGRAFMIVVPGHRGTVHNILNIYAPNSPEERRKLWDDLWNLWRHDCHLPLPTEGAGDWNFVEDMLDRSSSTADPVPSSFARLMSLFQFQDGWRLTFPDTRDYTCKQVRTDSSGELRISHSRLDRIYIPSTHFNNYRNWSIKHCAVGSDHRLVSVEYISRWDEKPGPGRWSMPLYLMKTPRFMKRVHELNKKLAEDTERIKSNDRDGDSNVQTLWFKYKEDIAEFGRHCSRFLNDHVKEVRNLEMKLRMLIHDEDMALEDRFLAIRVIEDKIDACIRDEADRKKRVAEARYDVEGESLRTKLWTNSAKGYTLKDSIDEFRIEKELDDNTHPRFESRPREMAKLAGKYHEDVQTRDIPDEYSRTLCTEMVLEQCDAHLSLDEYQELDKPLTEDEVRKALKLSKTGKAPGLDGIPYEFFKHLDLLYMQSRDTDRNPFDIMGFLAKLYLDVETHGIVDGTKFNSGWLCPFFKKGDKTLISNYRPITLLNTALDEFRRQGLSQKGDV